MVNPTSNVIHVTQNSHLASVVAGSERAKFDAQALANSEKTKVELDKIAKKEEVQKSETIDSEKEHQKEQGREEHNFTEEIEKMMKKKESKEITDEEAELLRENNDGDIPHLLDIEA
jgi:hypothetical protein